MSRQRLMAAGDSIDSLFELCKINKALKIKFNASAKFKSTLKKTLLIPNRCDIAKNAVKN